MTEKTSQIIAEKVDFLVENARSITLHVPEGSTMTICSMILPNGYTVVGKAACADPDDYDAGLGEDIAFENAKNKIFPLLAYMWKEVGHV